MKYSLSTYFCFLFTFILFCGCNPKQKADYERIKREMEEKRIRDSIEVMKRSQYVMGETFTGDRSQIIDLMKGQATFIMRHEGAGAFVVKLLKGDGTLIDVLANATGEFKEQKTLDIQETTAYILDVKTQGKWAITRK
jgi:hypothetical protein